MKKSVCEICKKEFTPYRKGVRTCSKKCCDKRYNIVNKEKIRQYNLLNKEKIKERRAKYYQENIERERENCKKWYAKNRESEMEKNREYRKQNKELFDWYHNKERFNGIRNSILKRDKSLCRVCGHDGSHLKVGRGNKGKLVVHHIDGKSYASGFKPEDCNNELDNLITLCNSCHRKLHWWQRKNYRLGSREDIVRTMTKVIEVGSKSSR